MILIAESNNQMIRSKIQYITLVIKWLVGVKYLTLLSCRQQKQRTKTLPAI
jgi:hypothetical protein